MAGSGTLDLLGGLGRGPLDASMESSQQIPAASQLTIFYSGTVNVYNEVPPDKAQAIMLLLSNGGDERSNRSRDADPMPGSPSLLQAPAKNAPASISRSSNVASTIFRPPFSGSATPPPSSPFQTPQPDRKPPQLISKRTQAELPFARKASLARFLEKRKDRVQAKVEAPEENFPDGASKKLKVNDDGIGHAE